MIYSRQSSIDRRQLMLLDGAAVIVAFLGATWLRHGLGLLAGKPVEDLIGPKLPGGVPWIAYALTAPFVALLFVLIFRYRGLYSLPMGRFAEAVRVAQGATIALIGTLALTFFYRGYSYSRATVLMFFPLVIASVVGARSLYRAYGTALRAHPAARRNLLIVGFGAVGRYLGRQLIEQPCFYEVKGFLDDDAAKAQASLAGRSVLGTTADLERVVREQQIEEVIIAIPSAHRERVMEVVGACMRLKLRWRVVPDLYGVRLERLSIDHVGALPLVGLRGPGIVGHNWALKRAFDLGVALLTILLTAPLWLLLAAAVKLTSRGPVLHRQQRIGLKGRPFTFLKFRSMRSGADAGLHRDYTSDWIYGKTGKAEGPAPRSLGAAALGSLGPGEEEGAGAGLDRPGVHKMTNDPRVTAVGRFLRRTSLDELPQLWNVVRGEMSLVGPRPPLPYEVERYTEWHKRRLDVLPGITGLWQVSGRNALSFEEMVRLDIEYIETWSLERDVKILLKTVPAVLFGRAW
jgi:exopolysaccharide biosynthesis polyprenyl glycosylphosphotransferase